MAESNIILTFEVYQGDALVKTAEFKEPSVTIGNGENAMLQVEGDGVAELHCVLNIEPDGSVQLLDLGSDAGIAINGEKVESNAAIGSGSSMTLGALRIVVNITDADAFDDEAATFVAPMPGEAAPNEAVLVQDEPEADAPMFAEDDASDEDEDEVCEDIMDFVMRSGTGTGNLGVQRERKKVLEVNQLWDQVMVDSQYFRTDPKRGWIGWVQPSNVSIGSKIKTRWHFLGVDMGWVPSAAGFMLTAVTPLWSEKSQELSNDFFVPDDNASSHDIFVWNGENYVAHIQDGWDGFIDVDDQRLSFDDAVKSGKASRSGSGVEVTMTDDVRLMVDVNGNVFFSHLVAHPKRVLSSFFDNLDFIFMTIIMLFAAVGLLFAILVAAIPAPPVANLSTLEDTVARLQQQEKKKKKEKDKKPSGNPDAGEGAKAKKEEGKVGKKEAKLKVAKGNKRAMDKSKMDRQIAENAGLMGALRDSGALDGLSGPNSDMLGGVGGLIGSRGSQIGSGGLGSRGSGLGGGGTAEGLGGLGTKGMGSGASGYGSGGGNFGAKGKGGIGKPGGDPIILGALDRALIDEVIKRHMNQIRYCYQRELNKSPGLGGKIVIKFVIAKDGSVSSAKTKTTTMNNRAVESCIEGRFMRFKFPEPKGGGIVIVSYPFIFSAG